SGPTGGLDPQQLDVFLGHGDGSFEHLPPQPLGVSPAQLGVDAADLDRDGTPDLILPGSQLIVLTGDGDGHFAPATLIALDPGMSLLKTTVDADDDGYLDLLGGGTALAQRMGPGLQPVGAPVPLGLTNGPVQFVVGDFDGDGLPDIAGQSQAAGG